MNILMLSDNYPPEMNANARIFSELASCWHEQTANVSVITSHPNFPSGKLFKPHKNQWHVRSKENGIEVIRVKTYIHENNGFIRRSLDFLSFGISSCIAGLFKKEHDIIVGISPQLFCALSACVIAHVKKKPFVLILCDLWPDAILHTGNLKKGMVFTLLKRMEIFLYKKAHLIATLSPHYNQYLINHGIEEKKIITSISGVDSHFYPRIKNVNIMNKYQLHHKFVIAYIGTFGVAHNHEDLLEVAEMLQKMPDMPNHLLLIGDGIHRGLLTARIKEKQLTHVTLDGPFPAECIPEYWSVADIALVTLADIDSNTTVIPSKMLESMAMGKPVVLYAPPGEAQAFLTQSKGGCFVKAGNKLGLKNTIEMLMRNPERLKTFSHNALVFSGNYTRKQQADALLDKMQQTVDTLF